MASKNIVSINVAGSEIIVILRTSNAIRINGTKIKMKTICFSRFIRLKFVDIPAFVVSLSIDGAIAPNASFAIVPII